MALVARASGSNRYGGPELHDVGPSAYPGQMLSPVYAVLSRLPYADPEPSPTSTTVWTVSVCSATFMPQM